MFEALFKYIKNYTTKPLSESEFELIKSAFVPKKLRRKQFFCRMAMYASVLRLL